MVFTGCASLGERLQQVPVVDLVQPSAAMPVGDPAPPASTEPPVLTGAIFQADRYRPLFENHRARMVGDTLNITITEKVSAVQKSTSSVNRKSSVDAGVTALPFLKSSALTRASATGNGNSEFSGNGTTDLANLRIPCVSTKGSTQFDKCPDHLPVVNGQKMVAYDVAAWADLWFYSNPIFIEVKLSTRVAGVQ